MKNNKLFKNLGFNGINSLISWGASVVIVGLMFKILHWSGGEFLIALGLITESLLFLLLGFVKEQPEQNESVNNNISIQFTDMDEDVNNCKSELKKLAENIGKANSMLTNVVDSVKEAVNK